PSSRPRRHLLFSFLVGPAPPASLPLPLHAALPISHPGASAVFTSCDCGCSSRRISPEVPPALLDVVVSNLPGDERLLLVARRLVDRKSTRLNSSHVKISYAVFCLKKKTTCTSTLTA